MRGGAVSMWKVPSALLLTLAGCDAAGSASSVTHTVTDSSGIVIVESTAPAWAEGEGWRIADEPEVVIGAIEGDERYLLSDVYAVARFDDGRIALIDGGASLVRVYDAEGRHLAEFGGSGDGPAEFGFATHLRILGDTVVVFDASPTALVWFLADGTHLRRVPLTPSGEREPLTSGYAFGTLDSARGMLSSFPRERPRRQPGIQREQMALWRYDMHTGVLDSVAQIRTEEINVRVLDDGRMAWNDLLFGRTTYYDAAGSRVFLAPTDDFSISVLDPTGAPIRVIRRPVTPRPAGEDDRARYLRQAMRGRFTDEEIEERVARSELAYAPTMPAHHLILADAVGNVWVEEFDDVGIDQGVFSVFDSTGVWLGRVDLPPGLPSLRSHQTYQGQIELGADHLLGVWVDELGIEQVRLYRIEK